MKRKISLAFVLLLAVFVMEVLGGITWIFMPFRSGMFARNISGYISYACNLFATLAPLGLMVMLHFNQKKPMAKFAGVICLLAAVADLYFAVKAGINMVRAIGGGSPSIIAILESHYFMTILMNLFIGLGYLLVGLELFTNTKSKKLKGTLIAGAVLIVFVGILRTVVHRPITELIQPLMLMLALGLLIPAFTDRNSCKMLTVKSVVVIAIVIGLLMVVPELLSGATSGNSSSKSRCTICGKAATNTFQNSGYCSQHYRDAIIWAMDNVSGK
jgi:hypothetical protein